MFYYISTNSWNLLESFVSESISPFSFYQVRGYGNNLSRYLDGTNERANYLILSTKEINGDYVLRVNDEILDKSNIAPVKNSKTLFTYNKTIYYKKGAVAFLFSSRGLLESLVAESQILFEVKCIEKYKSEFIVKTSNALPISTGKIANAISFQLQEYVAQDCIYDRLKGMIVAFTRAMAFAKNPQEQKLMCILRDLKNSFAGLNTQVMVSEIAVSNESKYISLIQTAKGIYNGTVKTRTNLFDILMQHFSEIVKLAKARAEEISQNKQANSTDKRDFLITQKDALESKLYSMECHDGISDWIEELNSIKKKERDNGIKMGKKREYFKKGTWEYERKKYLKQEIKKYEDENYEFKSIKQQIADIKQQITNIESGSSMYDTTLGALFVRVSDIMNDLIGKAKVSGEANGNIDYSRFSLKNLTISIDDLKRQINEAEDIPGMKRKTKAGKICYPLGRIIVYQDYLLLAFSHFENNQAKLSHNDYEICLRAMWNEISRVYANKPIAIPLLGGGITRITDKNEFNLLRCILCTLKTSNAPIYQPITIVLTRETIDKINLYDIKKIF